MANSFCPEFGFFCSISTDENWRGTIRAKLPQNFPKYTQIAVLISLPKKFPWQKLNIFLSQNIKNFFVFSEEKTFLLKQFPMDTENAVLTTLSKKFCQKAGVFLPIVQKVPENKLSMKKQILVELSFRARKTQF